MFKKILLIVISVTCFNILFGQNIELPPFSFEKFKKALAQCKLTYPNPHTKVVDKGQFEGYKSDFFYATPDGILVFVLKKDSKIKKKVRLELRQQQNHKDKGRRLNDGKRHILEAEVKLQKLENKPLEYTFLQIHSEKHPLLRVVVEKKKKDKINHIWAVVRISTKDHGKRTERYDLGKVSGEYQYFKIIVENNKLKIYRDGKLFLNKDVSYWPEKKNYFKVGIYDSKNSKGPWQVKLFFRKLILEETPLDKNNFSSGKINSGKESEKRGDDLQKEEKDYHNNENVNKERGKQEIKKHFKNVVNKKIVNQKITNNNEINYAKKSSNEGYVTPTDRLNKKKYISEHDKYYYENFQKKRNLDNDLKTFKLKVKNIFNRLYKKYGKNTDLWNRILTKIILKVNYYLRISKYRDNEILKNELLYIKNIANQYLNY